MALEMNTYNAERIATLASEAKSARGGSWLVTLAKLMGAIADKMGMQLVDMAKNIDAEQNRQNGIKAGGGEVTDSNLTELNAEMQAHSQLMKQFMDAIANIVKTIGDGNSGIARKG